MAKYFTIKEVTDMLNISESELRKLMKQREIGYLEIGEKGSKRKIKRFRQIDIDEFESKNLVLKEEKK